MSYYRIEMLWKCFPRAIPPSALNDDDDDDDDDAGDSRDDERSGTRYNVRFPLYCPASSNTL
jgi:hypothetical protein